MGDRIGNRKEYDPGCDTDWCQPDIRSSTRESLVVYALHKLIEDTKYIRCRTVISDRAPVEVGGNWLEKRMKYSIGSSNVGRSHSYRYSPWQNQAENSVREI